MILPPVAILLWCTGFLLLWKIPLCSCGKSSSGTISLIIPARNEERNLERLLRSITAQEPSPIEVIVVDDGSTDATADVARRLGARVIESSPLPEGWRGKTWACHQGAESASGENFLFVDADTFFMDGGLKNAAECLHEGVLSLAPYQEVPRPYEQLSAFFYLVMIMGTGAFTFLGDGVSPSGLFGQFMFLSARDYSSVGGHQSVKGQILENFFLARRFKKQRIPMLCRGGRGVLSIRMYPDGLKELVSGWSKAFVSGASEAPAFLTAGIAAWLTGAMLSFIMMVMAVLSGKLLLWPGLYILFALQIWFMLKRTGSFSPLTSAVYPLPLIFYFFVFFRALFRSALHRPVEWKGRTINTEKESA